MPVTPTSAAGTVPTVAGMSSSRNSASAFIEAASVPVPLIGIVMFATVPLRFVSTVIGFSICPVASARRSSAAIALRTVGAFTLDVLMTTLAGNAFPGNSCCMRSYVLTTASFCGNVSGPGVAMCICSAGIASAISKPAASEAERSGRRSTASTIPPQAPPSRRCAVAGGRVGRAAGRRGRRASTAAPAEP